MAATKKATKSDNSVCLVKTGTEYVLSLKDGDDWTFRASNQNYDLTNGDKLAVEIDNGFTTIGLVEEEIKAFGEALIQAYEENK